jgi:histidinol-phosphate aminotransferase
LLEKPYIPLKPTDAIKSEQSGRKLIKLGLNENRLGCSPKVAEALRLAPEDYALYPEIGLPLLKEVVADYHGLKAEQVLFGSGLFEIILLLAQAYLEPGNEVLVPTPSFDWYNAVSIRQDAVVREVPLKGYETDLDSMYAQITDRTKIIWLCNPNNPTGRLIPQEDLKAFIEKVPERILIVIDEAYLDFAPREYQSADQLINSHDNLAVLRTFSKLYGLASFRIGYILADPSIIDALNHVKQPLDVSEQAQIAARVSLEDAKFRDRVWKHNRDSLRQYYAAFDAWGLPYVETAANFFLVDVGRDSVEVAEDLAKEGILIRPGAGFGPGYETFLRISVGTDEDNSILLKALSNILNKKF